MVSPYIRGAQARMEAAADMAARRSEILSAHADHNPAHYTFARSQSLYTPRLQRLRPLESYLSLILCGCLGVAGMAALWLCLDVLADFINGAPL